MRSLVSAALSIRLFLLKEKSMIYHLEGRGKEDLGGGGELKGYQSTPIYYKGRVLKKTACQSTDNERGTITIL